MNSSPAGAGSSSRGLYRTVTDFRHTAGEGLVRQRVDHDRRPLTEHDVGDVGFVDFDLRLDEGHVRERQQNGPRVVHRPGHCRFAFLDVPARHDAVDRRFDTDFAEIVAGALKAGALVSETSGLCRHQFFALLQRRLRRPDLVLGSLERLPCGQLLRQSSCWRARVFCA